MEKILFVLKERFYSYSKTSYGLINSSAHLAEFLEHKGYECKVATVVDSNSIDKEIHEFKPDIVIIEALWVPTYKLKELIEIHRYMHIKWIVRVHSDIGFLSCEMQALKLINEYKELDKHNLILSLNNKEFAKVLSEVEGYEFTYLPNVIVLPKEVTSVKKEKTHIDIGCFGATRLLKNQIFQAICSIKAADKLGKKLKFHITPNLDQGNDPILANLCELFKNSEHELIIHDWLPNHEFQALVRQMDLGLQISYTESFNIIAADFVNNDRIILASDAISWLPNIMKTSTTNYEFTTDRIIYAYKKRNNDRFKEIAKLALHKYNTAAKHEWEEFLHEQRHGNTHKEKKRR